MSDGFIPSLLNTIRPSGQREARAVAVKIVEIPPSLANQTSLSGEVIATDKNKVQIKTDQGVVTLETDVVLEVGQKINLKIITTSQKANTQMVNMLLEIVDDKAVADQAPVRATPRLTASAVAAAKESVHLSALAQEYGPETVLRPDQMINTKLVRLPENLTREALVQLIKEMLILNPGADLPPTIEEGLDKIKTLLPLIRAELPYQNTAINKPISPLLLNLIQLILAAGRVAPATDFVDAVPVQNAVVLENIAPGIGLDGNIMRNFERKIAQVMAAMAVAQQQAAPPADAETPETPNTPAFATGGAAQKLLSQIAANPMVANALSKIPMEKMGEMFNQLGSQMNTIVQPEKLGAVLTNFLSKLEKEQAPPLIPGLALILGQKRGVAIEGKIPALMLVVQMAGTQSLALMTLTANETISPKTVLPGSVVLLAMPQQGTAAPGVIPELQAAFDMSPTLVPLRVSLGDTWPALEQLWRETTLNPLSPDAAALMRQTIPQPTAASLPPTLLFFMAALRHGIPEQWLGEALKGKVRQQEMVMIGQLTRDMQTIQSALNDPAPTESWRPLPMPLQVNDQLVRLQWFFRNQYDDSSQGDPEAQRKLDRKTRFLVDVPKTRVGDIQIDGLVQLRKLDVILRTESTLPSHMENAIRDRYHKALETSGYAGGVTFQPGRQHYIHV